GRDCFLLSDNCKAGPPPRAPAFFFALGEHRRSNWGRSCSNPRCRQKIEIGGTCAVQPAFSTVSANSVPRRLDMRAWSVIGLLFAAAIFATIPISPQVTPRGVELSVNQAQAILGHWRRVNRRVNRRAYRRGYYYGGYAAPYYYGRRYGYY